MCCETPKPKKVYPKPSLTADIVAVKRAPNPALLMIKRGKDPYKDCWALPGGFFEPDETIEQCARRELLEETAISADKLIPLGCYSTPNRDPRGWVVSCAFLTFFDADASATAGDDAADALWFDVCFDKTEDGNFRLTLSGNGQVLSAVLAPNFANHRFDLISSDGIAFDHAEMIAAAMHLICEKTL